MTRIKLELYPTSHNSEPTSQTAASDKTLKPKNARPSTLLASAPDFQTIPAASPQISSGSSQPTTTETPVSISEVRAKLANSSGREFWQSLEEVAQTPEFEAFIESEFPRQADPMHASVNRRDFLKILGGSLALAGLSACARPPLPYEKIVPYVRAPEEIIPGLPLFYATTLTLDGYGYGVLAESHQGRPTKIEGNPDHPASLGGTDAFAQASVLDLYDPDRSQTVLRNGGVASWDDFSSELTTKLSGLTEGSRLRILTETSTSPTFEHNIKRLQETYPGVVWHQYSPVQSDNARRGARLAFDQDVVPFYDFDKADVVVSLDADFLGDGPAKLVYGRSYSNRRRLRYAEDTDNKSRVYAFESTPQTTSVTSDHRVPLRAGRMEGLARTIANRLGLEVQAGITPDEVPDEILTALVDDLRDYEGSSIIIAGETQPAAVHALVYALNYVLGNIGQTVHFHTPATSDVDQLESLKQLTDDINAGNVDALLIFGGNPAYSAPVDIDFANALASVPFSAHLNTYVDETSVRTTWHLPQTHELEVWGDAKAFDGTISIAQPLIAPFVEGKASLEVLAIALGEDTKTTLDIVQDYWKARIDGSFDSFWREALYKGFVPDSAHPRVAVNLQPNAIAGAPQPAPQGLELVFRSDPTIYDGRFNNNGWLQEVPKPFTKLTWDNAALISPRLAERFDLRSRDIVELQLGDLQLEVPVWVQPGQAEETVTVHLGYGREHTGHVGEGTGFNAYLLRSSDNMWLADNLEIRKTRRRANLVSTQMHQQIEEGRHIVRHGTVSEFKQHPEHPHFVHPVEHHESDLYDDYRYEGYAWAMLIDMNVCSGCNACVIACQAENNIPIVGKEQVGRGREMHWLRIDTYYSKDLDNPEIFQMPVSCMHCEKAPCEPVCPVGATVHDHEGLNVMVYNRCVGTRYCSNACPYKVRRFNWLQYAELDTTATSLAMQKNPNVTVRSRGVMEKCTYCTQRIAAARIQSNNENRRIVDGEIVTACQAACPSQAIEFGDLSDPESRVVNAKKSPLNYGVLTELNTYPRTTYLARVANPHPNLESLISHDDPHVQGSGHDEFEPQESEEQSTQPQAEPQEVGGH